MTRPLALAEISMTRIKSTKFSYRHRRTIDLLACESHTYRSKPTHQHDFMRLSSRYPCVLVMLARDKQRKVECVSRLSRSQRTIVLPQMQTGKLPDTGPCSVLENNEGRVFRYAEPLQDRS